MQAIQVGLLGIGTVGSGTFNVLRRNQEEIKRRAGRGIEIVMVADLDIQRVRQIVGPDIQVVADAREVIANPDIEIVMERSRSAICGWCARRIPCRRACLRARPTFT